MDPKTVRKLEKQLYEAIADVICRLGRKKLRSFLLTTRWR